VEQERLIHQRENVNASATAADQSSIVSPVSRSTGISSRPCRPPRTGAAARGALRLLSAVTLQAVLGILTLLNQVPIGLALAHQAVAIAVLTLAVLQAERLTERQAGLTPRTIATPVGQTG